MDKKTEHISSLIAGASLSCFVQFLLKQYPKLNPLEATILASSILDNLPQIIVCIPSLQTAIEEAVSGIIAQRKND